VRAVKGAFAAVMGLTQSSPDASTTANQLEAQDFRVLAAVVGPPDAVKLAGIIALSDPPRTDSTALITELQTLGVRAVCMCGDGGGGQGSAVNGTKLRAVWDALLPWPTTDSPTWFRMC
jgi:cation transport ATPase